MYIQICIYNIQGGGPRIVRPWLAQSLQTSVLPGQIHLSLDNKAAIDSSYNPENHARTKHIDRRHYFIRELVEEGRLVVPYVSTVDNHADFFTKPLKPCRFFALRNKIMNYS